jgi:hypothetical protein
VKARKRGKEKAKEKTAPTSKKRISMGVRKDRKGQVQNDDLIYKDIF